MHLTDVVTREHMRIPVGPPRFGRRREELPPPLVGADVITWLVLSRVKVGAVTRWRGLYFDNDLPFPRYLLAQLYFDGLLAIKLVTISRDLREPELETVTLTDAGRAKLTELVDRCKRRTLT